MEEDDDMFAIPTPTADSGDPQSRSLYQVVNTTSSGASKAQYANAQDMVEAAARRRIEKSDLGNQRRSDLYDEKDKADFEDDVDNLLDVTAMGTDLEAEGGRRGAASRRRQEEYKELLEGEHIEPLSMKDEMKRGEVNVYGQMRQKKRKRRGEDEEENPEELAMPPVDGNGKSSKKKKSSRRSRLSTGDSSSSESDESDDEGQEDEEENQALEAEDPWLASVSKSGEDGIYHASKKSNTAKTTPEYLKDSKIALQTLHEMIKGGPPNETVMHLIKRLSPSSSSSSRVKKSKFDDSAMPSNSTDDQVDQEDKEERKLKFDKVVSIADYLLDSGYTGIYEATFDSISLRLQPNQRKENGPGQDSDEAEIPQGESGTYWQYKWTKESPEVFGPFDVDSMKSWAPSFQQFPGMVVRGMTSPAKAAKLGPNDAWIAFEPVLWS